MENTNILLNNLLITNEQREKIKLLLELNFFFSSDIKR